MHWSLLSGLFDLHLNFHLESYGVIENPYYRPPGAVGWGWLLLSSPSGPQANSALVGRKTEAEVQQPSLPRPLDLLVAFSAPPPANSCLCHTCTSLFLCSRVLPGGWIIQSPCRLISDPEHSAPRRWRATDTAGVAQGLDASLVLVVLWIWAAAKGWSPVPVQSDPQVSRAAPAAVEPRSEPRLSSFNLVLVEPNLAAAYHRVYRVSVSRIPI